MRNSILLLVCCLLLTAGPASGQYSWCSDMDSITAEVVGSDLILSHDLATYNCCRDSFTYTVDISDQTIIVTEYEVLTNPCFCLCCFNLSTTIEGLTPGGWSVVYRWLDDDEPGWSEWDLTVEMAGTCKTEIVLDGRIEDSGCLDQSGIPGAQVGDLTLSQNFPNPFNPGTTIVFVASGTPAVNLHIFDSSGRLVRTLLAGISAQNGRNEVFWDGRNEMDGPVASGVYFYRLEGLNISQTKRMVLLR